MRALRLFVQRHPNAAVSIYIDDTEYNLSEASFIGFLSTNSRVEDESNDKPRGV